MESTISGFYLREELWSKNAVKLWESQMKSIDLRLVIHRIT